MRRKASKLASLSEQKPCVPLQNQEKYGESASAWRSSGGRTANIASWCQSSCPVIGKEADGVGVT